MSFYLIKRTFLMLVTFLGLILFSSCHKDGEKKTDRPQPSQQQPQKQPDVQHSESDVHPESPDDTGKTSTTSTTTTTTLPPVDMTVPGVTTEKLEKIEAESKDQAQTTQQEEESLKKKKYLYYGYLLQSDELMDLN